jgi:hypothetical protein
VSPRTESRKGEFGSQIRGGRFTECPVADRFTGDRTTGQDTIDDNRTQCPQNLNALIDLTVGAKKSGFDFLDGLSRTSRDSVQ